MSATMSDAELKARHAGMWASGDYPSMVETFLLPLGPRLVAACGIGPGMRVLDVAAGTGNASIPAAQAGAEVTATDLTPALLDAGRSRAEAAGVALDWVEADAERLPFEDASFDVVMSSIGVMFAPHHQDAADELVRVCRPGGTIGLLSWTPEGHDRVAVRDDEAVRAAAAPRRAVAAALGQRGAPGRAVRRPRRVRHAQARGARRHRVRAPRDYGEHFKARYGPTIVARANAERNGQAAQFDAALDAFCDEWNRGTPDRARFEMQYSLAGAQVTTRVRPAVKSATARAWLPGARGRSAVACGEFAADATVDPS